MKTLRKITYRNVSRRGWYDATYPELRLSGVFLEKKYGWKPGGFVRVEYLKNKIVIKTER